MMNNNIPLIGQKQKMISRIKESVILNHPQILVALEEGEIERMMRNCEELLDNKLLKEAHPIAVDMMRLCLTLKLIELQASPL